MDSPYLKIFILVEKIGKRGEERQALILSVSYPWLRREVSLSKNDHWGSLYLENQRYRRGKISIPTMEQINFNKKSNT